MPIAFIIVVGLLINLAYFSSKNDLKAQESVKAAEIDSAVNAITYYGTYIKELAAYQASDGTFPNRALVEGYTGQASALINDIKTAGNIPPRLSWYRPYPGIDAILQAGSGQAHIYYKPIVGKPPIGADLSGLLHRVTNKVQRKYGSNIEAGEVIRLPNGTLALRYVNKQGVSPIALSPAIPEKAIFYAAPLYFH